MTIRDPKALLAAIDAALVGAPEFPKFPEYWGPQELAPSINCLGQLTDPIGEADRVFARIQARRERNMKMAAE